jgi:hypothetical protein
MTTKSFCDHCDREIRPYSNSNYSAEGVILNNDLMRVNVSVVKLHPQTLITNGTPELCLDCVLKIITLATKTSKWEKRVNAGTES